jgi:predicted lipoprotein with Yx(FWY)xxD motif
MESTTAPAEASTAQVPVTGSAAKIALSNSSSLGPILVDDRGMTLYLFQKDEPGTSNCYDKCAASWPPLLTSGAPVAGDGIDGSLLGTTTRKDGGTQATYNGWPLYYFAKDSQPGDVKGQGVGNVWYVITPSGQAGPAQAAAPTMPATPATNPAYQY